MLKIHFPIDGTKTVYRNTKTGKYVLASFSAICRPQEIMLFNCNGVGKIEDYSELYCESGTHLTPRDIQKVVDRFNEAGCVPYPLWK